MRILALEKELNLQADARKPGPRESALTGQLERLQADYSRLESELQVFFLRFFLFPTIFRTLVGSCS